MQFVIAIPMGAMVIAALVLWLSLAMRSRRKKREKLARLREKQEFARLSALQRERAPPRRGWFSRWR